MEFEAYPSARLSTFLRDCFVSVLFVNASVNYWTTHAVSGERKRGPARLLKSLALCVCWMVVWCVLATAVLVASTHAFSPSSARTFAPPPGGIAFPSVEGLAFGSSGGPRRPTSHQFQHMPRGLWARRRGGAPVRLSPAETDVPAVTARPGVKLDHADKEGDGGSSPSSNEKLTERGGLLLLATVPLVWGTYGTSVKLLYQMGESPPGLLFNFACYAVSVITFAAVAGLSKAKGKRPGGVCCVFLRWYFPALTFLVTLAGTFG